MINSLLHIFPWVTTEAITGPLERVAQQELRLPSGIWGLVLLLAAVFVVWLAIVLNIRSNHVAASTEAHTTHSPATEAQGADDLTKIEGIGPKIAGLLQAAGITTFAQLSNTEVSRLEAILNEAGSRYRLADPESWPEQSKLAAAGDWAALQTLQERLTGGRRV